MNAEIKSIITNTARHLAVAIMLPLLLAVTKAHAIDAQFSGFGTVGVSCFTADNADYVYNNITTGPGGTNDCDPKLDSKLGLQLDVLASEWLGGTLQVTSFHRADDTFDPLITLANVHLRPTQDLTLRAGRMQNPVFLFTEFRNVHYAQPFVRPPPVVYELATFFTFDGVAALYTFGIDDWQVELHAGVGGTTYDAPHLTDLGSTDDVEVDAYFLSGEFQYGPWLFKTGYSEWDAVYKPKAAQPFFDGLRSAGFSALANDLETDGDRFTLWFASGQFEDENWLLIAEYARRTQENSAVRNGAGAYVLVGHRFGAWMPYGIVGRTWTWGKDRDDTIPRGIAPGLDFLADTVDRTFRETRRIDHTSLSLGVSRELNEYSTLKLQVDWISLDNGSIGPYRWRSPDFDPSNPDDELLFTINLDFVF